MAIVTMDSDARHNLSDFLSPSASILLSVSDFFTKAPRFLHAIWRHNRILIPNGDPCRCNE